MQRFISQLTNGASTDRVRALLEPEPPVDVAGHHCISWSGIATLVADRTVVGVVCHDQLDMPRAFGASGSSIESRVPSAAIGIQAITILPFHRAHP